MSNTFCFSKINSLYAPLVQVYLFYLFFSICVTSVITLYVVYSMTMSKSGQAVKKGKEEGNRGKYNKRIEYK